MHKQIRNVQSFFFSQYFSDGLRITFGILLPSLIFGHFKQFEIGLTLSLGALCVSIVDTPGPLVHKRNGMLICNLSIFIIALITGLLHNSIYLQGIEIVVICFFFSMFTVYGNRAASLGTASLLVMIMLIDREFEKGELINFCLLLLSGGLWYTALSLSFFQIRPYRQAQQALGECVLAVSEFLHIKADFYDLNVDADENYHKLISQQIVVSEKQDDVRELLFKTRIIVKESTDTGRLLVLTFVDLVDMFEQIMATHYDYKAIREKFGATGVLQEVAVMIRKLSWELNNIGFAIQSNLSYRKLHNYNIELEKLKQHIDTLGQNKNGPSNLMLKKILINLRNVSIRITDIDNYLKNKESISHEDHHEVEYTQFVNSQDYSLDIFKNNLTFKSATFKHAVRVSLVCLIGFAIAKTISLGHHSYWILLTIVVILKPGFSLTKKRNFQRLIGTVAGGLIGALILIYVKNSNIQFTFLLLFMIGTYSFIRVNYIVSVIFMTPYIILSLRFLGVGQLGLIEERVIDTFIGSSIAFVASYLIFPTWESEQLRKYMKEVLQANISYLTKIAEGLSGKSIGITEYKLARKEVYVSSANLSSAFQRMTSEPRNKQSHPDSVHKFVVLNHIISSYSATIVSSLQKKEHNNSAERLRLLRRSIYILTESVKKLDPSAVGEMEIFSSDQSENDSNSFTFNEDDHLLKEQLGFIQKLCADIAKSTDIITGKKL